MCHHSQHQCQIQCSSEGAEPCQLYEELPPTYRYLYIFIDVFDQLCHMSKAVKQG